MQALLAVVMTATTTTLGMALGKALGGSGVLLAAAAEEKAHHPLF